MIIHLSVNFQLRPSVFIGDRLDFLVMFHCYIILPLSLSLQFE
jgi:hypothetical protein